jgi:1-phosphofructokinase family hexose kinase
MTALVVALNPAVDVEWLVDDVIWEEKNSIRGERRWAGGKGVNVARWLQHMSSSLRLLIPLGGATGREMKTFLRQEKIPVSTVSLHDATRANIIVTTRRRRQLRFNPLAPRFSKSEWKDVVNHADRLLRKSQAMVLSGSLPQGLHNRAYSQLIHQAKRLQVKTLLDCDGAPFTDAVEAGPFLVKPNRYELSQWMGHGLASEKSMRQAAITLSRRTRGWVLLSQGAKGGVLANAIEGCAWKGLVPPVSVANTIGAGDAMLAAATGQILQQAAPQEWLRWALAAGTALTMNSAGKSPAVSAIHQILEQIKIVQPNRCAVCVQNLICLQHVWEFKDSSAASFGALLHGSRTSWIQETAMCGRTLSDMP